MHTLSPGRDVAGEVHVKQIYEIAKMKQLDEHLSKKSLAGLSRSIVGTAMSMGIKVVK